MVVEHHLLSLKFGKPQQSLEYLSSILLLLLLLLSPFGLISTTTNKKLITQFQFAFWFWKVSAPHYYISTKLAGQLMKKKYQLLNLQQHYYFSQTLMSPGIISGNAAATMDGWWASTNLLSIFMAAWFTGYSPIWMRGFNTRITTSGGRISATVPAQTWIVQK